MPISNTAAAAGFQNAEGYEKVMGRWSRRLAPLLIRFGGLSDGDRVLVVGCGTGSLTFTLPEIANIATITGIDLTEGFVEFARAHNNDPRISFERGDARILPFEDNSFDRAFSMLVLQFIPDAASAVAEMRRVIRSDPADVTKICERDRSPCCWGEGAPSLDKGHDDKVVGSRPGNITHERTLPITKKS